MVSLATQEVEELNSPPAEDDLEPGTVYYIKGSFGSANWESKRDALESGGAQELTITEAELNNWSSRELRLPESEDSPGTFSVAVHEVNFRLADEQLQVGGVVELPGIAPGKQFIYQARGHFEPGEEEGAQFVVTEGSLGKAPIGYVPVLGNLVLKILSGAYEDAEEYTAVAEAWKNYQEARVEDGRLLLSRG